MSTPAVTATSTEPAKRRQRPNAQTDEPGTMPQNLKDAGWMLKEHVGDDNDKFQCVNAGLNKTTNAFYLPQEAIKAARRIQQKHEADHLPEQLAASTRGSMTRQFTRMLKVRLLPDGLQAKCAEFDAKCAEKEAMEADHKKVNDRFREDLKVKDAEVQALEQIVRKQYVETETPCEERYDYEAKVVRVVRLDTNEELEDERREMTAKELQQRLPSV